jgi:hypothetical protein
MPQGSCVKARPSAALRLGGPLQQRQVVLVAGVVLAAGALATVRAATPGQHGVRCAHQQDGHRSLAASASNRACQVGISAGGPRSQALRVQGDRRRTLVPDAARAWAGGQCGGTVPPHPSQVAALRGRSIGL